MINFDPGVGGNTTATSSQSQGSAGAQALGKLGSALGAVGKLAGALSNLSNPGDVISKLRSINLPSGGNVNGQITSAGAQWSGSEADKDWRVRLSLPTTQIYTGSPVLQPLKEAGGLIFPYTPQINISSQASYDEVTLTHQNFPAISYQNSKPDQITIMAPFNVEDSVQAQYWLAAVHYLRSLTKMFTGDIGAESGNPPPIILLNGYGDFVFKNIPVVVKSFSIELPQDTNYIATTVGQAFSSNGLAGPVAGAKPGVNTFLNNTSRLAGLAGALGRSDIALGLTGVALATGVISGLKNAANSNGSGVLAGAASGGGFQGASHVPAKSTINVTLLPIYSRESMRKFNLADFVGGKYVGNKVGYI